MAISQKEYEQLLKNLAKNRGTAVGDVAVNSVKNKSTAASSTGTGKNGLEQSYEDEVLKVRMILGEIVWYKFEGVRLKLANNTTYTPDFVAVTSAGLTEFHETKGFWRDDARVKIKLAASEFSCYKFIAITKEKGQFVYEVIKAAEMAVRKV